MSKGQSCRRYIAGVAIFALIYFIPMRLSLGGSLRPFDLLPPWFASGIALAGVLLFGWRFWPGIWLGTFAVYAIGGQSSPAGFSLGLFGMAALIATGNVLMAAAGTVVITSPHTETGQGNGWVGPLFAKVDALRFSAIAFVIPLISAGIGAAAICAYGTAPWGEYPLLGFAWWLGDVTGILVVTPFLLAWSRVPKEVLRFRCWGSSVLANGLLLFICQVVYSGMYTSDEHALPLGFLIVGPLAWVALRGGPWATPTAILLLSVVSSWYTAHHLGPLAISTDLGTLLLLRGFLIAAAIPTHVLEWDSSARRKAEAEVKALNATLERRIKKRMLELERSYQRYQILAANLPNGAVFLFDEDLRFIVVDGMALKRCGWNKHLMEGKTVREALPAQIAEVFEQRFRAALAGAAEVFEQSIAGYDFLVYTLPVRGAQDGVFAGMTMCMDITEQKLAQEKLREGEERFNAFMRNLPGVAFMKDREGHYIYASDRVNEVVGLGPKEVLGMNVFDFWPADAPRVTAQDEEMRRTGRPIQTVETLPMKNGLHYWLMHKFPIPDSTGKFTLIGGMAIDITDRVVAEQKVEAALKKEEVLKREIHHRVKNNLQVVISMLYLQSAEVADPVAREILLECQSRTRSIALIYAMLSESENLTRIEFLQYARQLTADLLTAYRANPDNINLTIDAEGIFLSVDASLPCGLILTELVSNSLKYAFPHGRKGRIAIELHPLEGGLLNLTVRDNGVGFPADFDLENPRSMGYKLVRDLTRQLCGTITCSSNHGAGVTVSFPLDGNCS